MERSKHVHLAGLGAILPKVSLARVYGAGVLLLGSFLLAASPAPVRAQEGPPPQASPESAADSESPANGEIPADSEDPPEAPPPRRPSSAPT